MQLVVLLFDNKQFTELEFMTDNDLETSEVPLSVLFCIIEKNASFRDKGNNNICFDGADCKMGYLLIQLQSVKNGSYFLIFLLILFSKISSPSSYQYRK